MGFSPEWEQRYAGNTHISVWPWSDIVSLVHRYCKHIIRTGAGRVLELGCGAGANIPLFLSLGMNYFAIEGSTTIVAQLHERYPELATQITLGDFTDVHPYGNDFHLVVDRAAVTHNNTEAIRSALQLAHDSLVYGGIFIGTDWFSTSHSEFTTGTAVDDAYTRTNHTTGPFAGVGKVHFSDEPHLRELFSNFEILYLEEKYSHRYEPRDNYVFAAWNIVARKTNA